MADKEQPALTLLRDFAPAKMAALLKKLTGREPTAEEAKDLAEWCEKINARLAKRE